MKMKRGYDRELRNVINSRHIPFITNTHNETPNETFVAAELLTVEKKSQIRS